MRHFVVLFGPASQRLTVVNRACIEQVSAPRTSCAAYLGSEGRQRWYKGASAQAAWLCCIMGCGGGGHTTTDGAACKGNCTAQHRAPQSLGQSHVDDIVLVSFKTVSAELQVDMKLSWVLSSTCSNTADRACVWVSHTHAVSHTSSSCRSPQT